MIPVAFDVTVVDSSNKAALALMAQLHRRAFSAQDEHPWNADAFANLMSSPGFEAFLYSTSKRPVGFALVRSVCDEAELISIAVDPAEQGKGFAKQVMRHLLERLKEQKIRSLFLEVRQDNEKAIQLYRLLGFKKIGERRAYYRTFTGIRRDAYVFSLIIE